MHQAPASALRPPLLAFLLSCGLTLAASALAGQETKDSAANAQGQRQANKVANLPEEQTMAKSLKRVRFVHRACTKTMPLSAPACAPRYKLSLSDGQAFAVEIQDTDTMEFSYSIEPQKREDLKTEGLGEEPHHTKTLILQHDKRYRGYLIHIIRSKTTGERSRGDAVVTIEVATREWGLEFGGGFTVSGLRDPVYAVRTDSVADPATGTQTAVLRINREKKREDEQRLGLGSFVHVYNTAFPAVAFTFGLGLEQNRAASYYFGPSLRLGGKATLTGGVLWGSVNTLPKGFSENQIVKDANVISTLGNRTKRSWFVSVSYSFIGGADKALAKPFANQPPPAGATEQQGAPSGGKGDTPAGLQLVPDPPTTAEMTLVAGVEQELIFKFKNPENTAQVAIAAFTQDDPPKPATDVEFSPKGSSGTSGPLPQEDTGQYKVKVKFNSPGKFFLKAVVDKGKPADLVNVTVTPKAQ